MSKYGKFYNRFTVTTLIQPPKLSLRFTAASLRSRLKISVSAPLETEVLGSGSSSVP